MRRSMRNSHGHCCCISGLSQGPREQGMFRSRTDGAGAYISAAHSAADRSTSPDIRIGVGPGQYNVAGTVVLSQHRKPGAAVFGSAARDAKDSLTQHQMLSDPAATTAADTPLAAYDIPVPAGGPAINFGKGKRTYAPEKGPSTAGPYIGR
jgi:hypothetical protein